MESALRAPVVAAGQHIVYGAGRIGGETVFVPRAGAKAEDDGYVVTLVTDSTDWSSHCLVFDATDVAAGPIVRVTLPQRVPGGFHASWAPGI